MGIHVVHEQVGRRAIYRVAGEDTFQAAIATLLRCVRHAARKGAAEVLVDAPALGGFEPPGTMGRFRLGADLAELATVGMRCAFVLPPELIDRDKFGTVVALNRGFDMDVFPSRAGAEAWLDAEAREADDPRW